jgi:glycosyltransferase involved in cell wall biosynthesis
MMSEKSILFIGRCLPRRGFNHQLKIWEIAHQELPGFELILIAETHDNQKVATGRGSRIKRLGLVFDFEKSNLLNRAKIVLIPSRYESFGIVPIEAMLFGTPLVVSKISGLSDFAESSPSLVACGVEDINGFTEKFVTIVRDSKILEIYSRKPREDFKEFYKVNKVFITEKPALHVAWAGIEPAT